MASLISTLIEKDKSLLNDDKPNSNFEAYKKIRKPTPPPSVRFKDGKKYNRKNKANYDNDDA